MARSIKKILITAGPTREMLDPVRFISNLSTGEMGYAIAGAALRKKCQVTLVSGPTALRPPRGVCFVSVISAQELKNVCSKLFPKHDCLIMTAAVCDFTPAKPSRHKIPSRAGYHLRLKRTPDVLAALAKRKGKRIVIGFCLETQDLIRRAKKKLIHKKLDGIVANLYNPKSHIPFGKRRVQVAFIDSGLRVFEHRRQSKKQVANKLLAWMEMLHSER